MHLTRLALTDFRCYATADLRLEPGVTIVTGPNGAGKTNLVEAVSYAATFGSHRVSADAPLIRLGAQRAIVRAAVAAAAGDSLVEIEINPGRANRVRLNRVPVPRPREVLGTLRCVLFAPEDVAIVKGDPDQRRRFLDDLLIATRPRFAGIRADYERVVRQRTALLKSARAAAGGRAGSETGTWRAGGGAIGALAAWDEQLISAGVALTAGRMELVAEIGPLVRRAYTQVSGAGAGAEISYRTAFEPPDSQRPPSGAAENGPPGERPDPAALEAGFRAALARLRRAELERGQCLSGPHRDDLELGIGGLPARGYASHGECWSLALALRLAGYELLRSGGEDPVLLLDDVFAELDARRRASLAELAAGAEQVLVTAAVPADVPAVLAGERFTVSAGTVSRVQ